MRTSIIVCLLAIAMNIQSAWPLSLVVSPYRVVVTEPNRVGVFKILNTGDQPINVQLRSTGWQQVNSADEYPRTSDVFVNPPMAKLAPHSEQTVRFIRISKAPIKEEETYKLIIDELPADISRRKPGELSFISRYIMPVFYVPKTKVAPHVTWSAKRSGNKLLLTATNNGNSHLKISALKLYSGNKELRIGQDFMGYVLKGATMTFTFDGITSIPNRLTFRNYDQLVDVRL